MTVFANLESLVSLLRPAFRDMCRKAVLSSVAFQTAPASAGHHPEPHRARGGLVLHTWEVANYMAENGPPGEFDRGVTAAIFHDYAKVREYAFGPDGKAYSLPFRFMVGHVVASWRHFCDVSVALPEEDREVIGHALLAHHGRREYGSPVEPQTRLAHTLHFADGLSARGML